MHLSEFIARWSAAGAAERANKDAFLLELCDVLEVPRPDPTSGDPERDRYVFERDARLRHPGGSVTIGKMDLYKEGCFILEAKQGSQAGAKKLGTAKRGTPAWHIAMRDAYGQALRYASTLDRPPPFLVVCDLGYCFDLYASFDGSGVWRPFPDAQRHRLFLSDLGEHRETLRQIFLEPSALDPSRVATRVTREVAAHLAELARSLEAAGHPSELVAEFLMRCLFTMALPHPTQAAPHSLIATDIQPPCGLVGEVHRIKGPELVGGCVHHEFCLAEAPTANRGRIDASAQSGRN